MRFNAIRRGFAVCLLAVIFCALVGTSGAKAAAERKMLVNVAPAYTDTAKRLRLSGLVRIEVRIAEDGSVQVVKILGGHPLLADCAAKAVAKWKYERGAVETREVQVKFVVPTDSY